MKINLGVGKMEIKTDKYFKDNLLNYLLMGAMICTGISMVALTITHIIDLQMYIHHGCTIISNIQPCDLPQMRTA